MDAPEDSVDLVVEAAGYGYVSDVAIGVRFCPDDGCKQLILVVYDHETGTLLYSAPPESMDFDSTDLPDRVNAAISEAARCYGMGCYVAAAIMIRKTLEEVCKDRNAEGASLRARLRSLGSKIIIPQELLDGIDNLRLLGNDGAHVDLNDFDQVGRPEVEAGFLVAKEFLKAVYQYKHLISALEGLKRSTSDADSGTTDSAAPTTA